MNSMPATSLSTRCTSTSLDRRSRQDDAIDAFLEQRLDRLRHRQKSFSGARRADAEDGVVLVYRFEVTALHGRARHYLLLARRVQPRLDEVIAQGRGAVFG